MLRESLLRRVRNAGRWDIAIGIFLILLTTFLAVRAADEFRWSDWGFGDAQTMLSLRQWEEGGWFANYFLFIPQGYAKVIRMLDDPRLRQHAHGTCPGSSPRVGPRLWYTHYPAGYLLPYAVFFRLGLDSLPDVRMLSIAFSVGALVLMYILFAKITSPAVSFLAVVFYGLTPTFLGYADTLANQPLDDILRFGFMLAIVHSTRSEAPLLKRRWAMAGWAMEFMLSLSSFDSVFFMFAWIIGWDIIEGHGFRWKRYFLFGLAPLTAHGLQFLQNVWYLGVEDAVTDIKDAFLLKNAADASYNAGQDRLTVILDTIGILFNNLYTPGMLIAVFFGLYLIYLALIRSERDATLPSIRMLLVLFFCGLSFILVLPHAARMPYESRQMIPFAALLVSGVTWSFPAVLRESILGGDHVRRMELLRSIARPLYLLGTAVLLMLFWYQFLLNPRHPVYYIPDEMTDLQYASAIESKGRVDLIRFRQLREEALFAIELSKLKTQYEPVFMSIDGFRLFWDARYVPGYPQIMPLTEYYTGSRPVLCFNAPDAAAKDLIYLAGTSPFRFSPVLLASDREAVNRLMSDLAQAGYLTGEQVVPYEYRGRYVLDLTNAVRWGR